MKNRIWLVLLVALAACSGDGGKNGNLTFSDSLFGSDIKSVEDTSHSVSQDLVPGEDVGGPFPDLYVPPDDDIIVKPGDLHEPPPDLKPDPPDGPCNYLQQKVSLDDLKAGYNPGNWNAVLNEMIDRRYDAGHYIMTHLQDQSRMPMFVQTNSFQDLAMSASTAVHEGNHMYGWELSDWDNYSFFLCEELVITVSRINTPARSIAYSYIPQGIGGMVMDYADLYLTGTMGDQGMFTLLDELNAYTHSIFVDYQLVDQIPTGMSISSLDGLATFMLFTELYLKAVRETQSAQYNTILATPGIKQLILDLWNRCEWIIDNSADQKNTLNIMADPVLDAVFDVDYYSEITFLMD